MKGLGVLKIFSHPTMLPLAISTFISLAGPGGVAEITTQAPIVISVSTPHDPPLVVTQPTERLFVFVPVRHTNDASQTAALVDPELAGRPIVDFESTATRPTDPNESGLQLLPGVDEPDVTPQEPPVSVSDSGSEGNNDPAQPAPEQGHDQAPSDEAASGSEDAGNGPSDTGEDPNNGDGHTDGPGGDAGDDGDTDDDGDLGGGSTGDADDDGGNGEGQSGDDGGGAGDDTAGGAEPVCDPPGNGPAPHDGVPPGHDNNEDGIDDRCQEGDEEGGPDRCPPNNSNANGNQNGNVNDHDGEGVTDECGDDGAAGDQPAPTGNDGKDDKNKKEDDS